MIAKIRRVGKRISRTSGCASANIRLSKKLNPAPVTVAYARNQLFFPGICEQRRCHRASPAAVATRLIERWFDQYGGQTFRGGVRGRGWAGRTRTVDGNVV